MKISVPVTSSSLAIVTTIFAAVPASAANFLYYTDGVLGTDQFLSALGASGNTYTVANDDADFLNLLQTRNYDVGALFVQDFDAVNYTATINSLSNFVAGGGQAIYADLSQNSALAAGFGVSFTGSINDTNLTILDPRFGTSVTLTNPGWANFSSNLTALPGSTVAATFSNGDAAIVLGNGNRSIVYGFANDTTTTPRVFRAGIELLAANGTTAVPEPFTIIGTIVGGTAAVRLRRRLKADRG